MKNKNIKQWKKHGEVRLNSDGSIDEIVVVKPEMVHLEQMDDGLWWMGITAGNIVMHVNISTKRNTPIHVNCETDDGIICAGFIQARKQKK